MSGNNKDKKNKEPEGNDFPFISVIIPTMNNKDDLIECLTSLQKINYPKNKMELIVWDNGSVDGTEEAANQKIKEMSNEGWHRTEIVRSSENLGSYIPFNKVASELNREIKYILALDDDVVLEKDCIKKLIEVTKHDSSSGVIGGRIFYFDFPQKIIQSAGWINWWAGRFVGLNADCLTECDYVIGCCCLINRDIFDEAGGFDRDYFTSEWEMDFCRRVQKKGFKIYYQPEAIAMHKVSIKGERGKRLYYQYRNKILLIRKNSSSLQKLTSLSLYSLFWLPKIILNSLIANRGINAEEIIIIVKAVWHGIIGKTGKLEE